ncbi:MAG: hypothetical protein JNK82_08385 [Myxococcaceae bacterium]|nr:hypothetical protein [Myxococcaceae bacterium]
MSSDENELKKLTVRELRTKAVKELGSKVAAGLKLKAELVDALSKKTKAPRPRPTAPKPKATAPKARASAPKPKASAPKASAPKPKAKPSAPRARAKKTAAGAAPSPPPARPLAKTLSPTRAARGAIPYELPITRDFFVDPRKPSLPASYGDDRLLCFRREPLAIVVSWDLSAKTFDSGRGLSLELVTQEGRLVGSVAVTAPTGLATFAELPGGQPLSVQVVRQGRVVTRARPFVLGDAAPAAAPAPAFKMTVPFDAPLPTAPERRRWPDAPPPVVSPREASRASSSRLSS